MISLSRARFFPKAHQRYLLQACLLRNADEARAAWKKWKACVDLDDLDPASFRIMSLAYRRMIDLGIDDPDAGRMKGLYRYHWTRNQLAWRGKDRILRGLEALGIPTLLLKGAALSRTVYREPATRGMHDLDVLVPVKDAARAMDYLQGEGWVAQHFDAKRTIDLFHGCSFLHPDFGELDLHWHVMRSGCREERTAELWAASRQLKADGIPTRALCPADMLLHACEHGMHPSPASELQWLVDSATIIRSSGDDFDWGRLVDQARKFQLVLMVRRTLHFLRRHLDPGVQGEALAALDAERVTKLERVEYFLAGRPEGSRGLPHRLSVAACYHFRRTVGTRSGPRIIAEFPLYYRLLRHEKREWAVVFDEEWLAYKRKLRDDRAEWKFRLGRLMRLRSPARGGLITRLPAEQRRNFHPPEKELGSPFLWSEPAASIELKIPRRPTVLRFGFKPYRDLTRLFKDGLAMRVNGHPIPAERFQWRDGFLYAAVPVDSLRADGRQKLSWTIDPWPAAPDPRELGLPLSRLWHYRGRDATA